MVGGEQKQKHLLMEAKHVPSRQRDARCMTRSLALPSAGGRLLPLPLAWTPQARTYLINSTSTSTQYSATSQAPTTTLH